MSPRVPTHASGQGRTSPKAEIRSGTLPYMSEKQTEAYLLARNAVRRIQRTSALVSGVLQRQAGRSVWFQRNGHQSH